jgi:hypothetical protein
MVDPKGSFFISFYFLVLILNPLHLLVSTCSVTVDQRQFYDIKISHVHSAAFPFP